jgi:allophanate hydrolase
MNNEPISLLIADLLEGYRAKRFTPAEVMQAVLKRIHAAPQRHVWIARLPEDQVMAYAQALESKSIDDLPLYGIPFAIKDNIDLSGIATTAACPDYQFFPEHSATVVHKLIAAGAIPVGKTNLDQFATGLVGIRSPYGACSNSIDPDFISGGSSAGSAVAVASGLVSFALGTDTAGSGRVPAAFNNIVGLKPSCGLLSTAGVVPACRSLDCVSIFTLTADDAQSVLKAAQGFDALDPYSKDFSLTRALSPEPHSLPRIGVPRTEQLEFFGDDEYRRLFAQTCARIAALGWTLVEIDFTPFLQAARLLYEGPWVSERYAAIAEFIEQRPASLHPVTAQIIGAGKSPSAVDAFRAQYRLQALRRTAEQVWRDIDVLMTPTAGTIYSIAAVTEDPIRTNSNLGYYTNFVNLLDLAAVAVPAGFRSDDLPFGITLIASSGSDAMLLEHAGKLHRASVTRLGALSSGHTTHRPSTPPVATGAPESIAADHIAIIVCGAHMSGLPLNHQLRSRNAHLISSARTSAHYRFYALPGGPPHRPGLIRVNESGSSIEVEVWAVPQDQFGSFVAGIPSPLGIGQVELENGAWHCGFLCESWVLEQATEITALGGWRRYLRETEVTR